MIYYGVRKSKVFDVGTAYFSSSKLVKRLIDEYGIVDFEFKLRRKFESYAEARAYETSVLKRLQVPSNPNVLNQAISSPRVPSKDSEAELRRKASISKHAKQVWSNPEYRRDHPFTNQTQSEQIKRGRKGSLVRAARYKNGELTRKIRKTEYKEVQVVRDGETKTVKMNQVPAYRKYGWERL